jgi:hypothetical protein
MKKVLLFAGLLLVLTATVAMAGGVNVSWKNFCWGDEGSINNLTWACASNSNTNIRMTCSFMVDQSRTDFGGAGVYLEGMSSTPAVPDWWKVGDADAQGCRVNGMSSYADYSVLPADIDGGVCSFAFGENTPSGGLGAMMWDGNRMHANAAWATAADNTINAGKQYFICQFRVAATATLNGTCTGCSTPVIWALNKVNVGYFGLLDPVTLDTVIPGGNQCLSWQNATLDCGLPVPARNTTWGQVKSLYR